MLQPEGRTGRLSPSVSLTFLLHVCTFSPVCSVLQLNNDFIVSLSGNGQLQTATDGRAAGLDKDLRLLPSDVNILTLCLTVGEVPHSQRGGAL